MRKLKPENGSTKVSLSNLALISVLHGPMRFILHFAPIIGKHKTLIGFQDSTLYRATGFSSGDRGERAAGLQATIEMGLKRSDITIPHIKKWGGSRYFLLPSKGCGRMIYSVDDHTELW